MRGTGNRCSSRRGRRSWRATACPKPPAALRDVLSGEIEVGRATAAATVARSLIAAKEAGTLEERLAALERRVGVANERTAS